MLFLDFSAPLRKFKMDLNADECLKKFRSIQIYPKLLETFSQAATLRDKVRFCFQNENIQSIIQDVIQQFKAKECLQQKDEAIARSFRLQGNDFFKEKQYEEALDYYTKALIVAPHDSSELSTAHANRSACYYYLDRYNQCLQDVEFALKSGHSTPIKLVIRKSKTLHSMGDNVHSRQLLDTILKSNPTLEKQMKQEIQLLLKSIPEQNNEEKTKLNKKPTRVSWEVDSKSQALPAACEAVEIQFDEEKGRKLVAKQKISTDEVVLIAEPLASFLRSNTQNDTLKCESCYRSLDLLKRPPFSCRSCIFVKYCSPDCEDTSWQNFHQYECGTLRSGMKWCGDDALSARVLTIVGLSKALTEFKESQNETPGLVGNNYKTLLTLMDHSEDFDAETLLLKSLKAAFLTILMHQEGKNLVFVASEENLLTLGELLLKHILQIRINGMFVTAETDVEKQVQLAMQANSDDMYGELVSDEENVALGLYPELSLLNHSCDPNLYQRNGIKTVTQALKDIEPGEELTITYGPVARGVPKAERQQQLMERYFFTCNCIACCDDQYEQSTAFKCPDCKGPVKYNLIDKSNECLKCGKKNPLYLDKTIKLRDFGRNSIVEALQLMNKSGCVDDALIKLKKGFEILKHVLYESNRELGIMATEITLCYTKLSRYEEAEEFADIGRQIVGKVYGEDSYQYAVEMMRLTELQRMRMDTEFPLMIMNEEYWKKAIATLNETVVLYEKHVGDAKRNKDSFEIRREQVVNLRNQQAELMKKSRDSNSLDYAINLLKQLKSVMKSGQ